MNVLVINGSPKGTNSITLQSMLYLEKVLSEHDFSYLDIGPKLRMLEKDMAEAEAMIAESDLLVFSYPVYTFLVPYQMHRFIEMLKESGVDTRNKWATQFSTSKHFYDITAHRFLKENMLDLGMKVLPGLSADMEDLLLEKGRKELLDWWKMTEFRTEESISETRDTPSNDTEIKPYSECIPKEEKSSEFRISIVTNADRNDIPLLNMIADFRNALCFESTVYNIREYPFSGGCLGCFSCAINGKCIHKDKFDDYLRSQIQNADSIVYAFRISNHFTHSSMKCYDDRQFCNGHRTVTSGRPTAYIVAGNLSSERNLQDLIEARASVGGNFLSGIATDENNTTPQSLKNTADSLCYALKNSIEEPKNFFGVGGSKIFRDLIFEMRGLMKADHRFYKAQGFYDDFPQKHRKKILMMKFIGLLLSMPGASKKKGLMTKGMLMPYQKVLDSANK